MYSNEHLLFIKKLKKERRNVKIVQILIVLLFVIIWQLLASFNIINTFIFSSPKMILNTIVKLYSSGDLFHHIFVTFYETIISFLVGTLLGCLIATILWWNNFLNKVFDPYLTILNSLPKVALGPIIIIWGGANIKSIIIMALLVSVIITIINVANAFNNIDENKLKLMKTFKASKLQTYFKLVLPSSYNIIINSLKINISMSLIGVIMGEFLVSKEGLGYLIMYGSQVFNLNLVICGIILLCILSFLMYYSVLFLEKRLKK